MSLDTDKSILQDVDDRASSSKWFWINMMLGTFWNYLAEQKAFEWLNKNLERIFKGCLVQ